ncbi:M15 family metallopeptidase [Streptomyces sp. NPDC002990]
MRLTPTPTALAAAVVLCVTGASCTAAPPRIRSQAPIPALAAEVVPVPPEKIGPTHRPGCPVPVHRLRLIRMNHWGFDGKVHRGELVVHEEAVRPLLQVFGKAFEARFPIRRMRVMAEYDGNDARAMADDNTSAYNCRRVTGAPALLSRHAYGDAVDINTVENPYVDGRGAVHPPEGRRHLRRDRPVPGMIREGDVILRAFRDVGWHWGGRWSNPDYQHFSANGE